MPEANSSSLLPKVGIKSEWDSLLRHIRPYSAGSMVDLALYILQFKHESEINELRNAPWQLLLLVKWALQDTRTNLRVGPRMPMAVFDQVRQEMWELPGKVVGDGSHGLAMMRSILNAQIDFQRPEGWEFLRWPALISRCPSDHSLRKLFRQHLRMDPATYMDLAFALQAYVLDGRTSFNDNAFASLRRSYRESVDGFLGLFVRSLPDLRIELRKPEAQQVRGRGELNEFPYLRRFPLVRLRNREIVCWHPLVLARGLEDAVHLRLSEAGSKYTEAFSRVFEQYVVSLSREANSAIIDEEEYKNRLGAQAPSVEAIWREDQCTILIEAKMALFGDALLVTDDLQAIYHKTKRVANAVAQGWKVTEALSNPANPYHIPAGKATYLVIVTSRELNLTSGPHLASLYPDQSMAQTSAIASRNLPISQILVMSILDFERMIGCVIDKQATLSQIVHDVSTANADPLTAKMFIGDHLYRYTKRFRDSSLIQDAVRTSMERLKCALRT